MWNLVSTRVTQFSYFNTLLNNPTWQRRRILDFGGNVGTFLAGAGHEVDHSRYLCLDLNREVLEQGQRDYPRAKFLHYDRYNTQYNPTGTRDLPIPECGRFDFALAFSVFTHTHRDEMVDLVGQMRDRLNPGGVLAFTFCDARYDRSVTAPDGQGTDTIHMIERQRRNYGITENSILNSARRADWFLQIDNDVIVEPGPEFCHQRRVGRARESYCSFFTAEYVESLFPDGTVLAPVKPEWQHCCILRN